MFDIRIGDLVKNEEKKGVIFSSKLLDEDGNEVREYGAQLLLTIRWEDGTITEVNQDEFYPSSAQTEAAYSVITPKLYVNVYLHDRAYGGPEEGGWWYDTYSPDECIKCETEEEAERIFEEKCKELEEENKERRPITSVLSTGQYEVRLEAYPAEHEPKYRPIYC